MFTIIVRNLGSGHFSYQFKISSKTAIISPVVAKYCSDLTLLCIDNQHLFCKHHVAKCVPASGGKTDSGQIHIESHSSVDLYPVFYLEVYL